LIKFEVYRGGRSVVWGNCDGGKTTELNRWAYTTVDFVATCAVKPL